MKKVFRVDSEAYDNFIVCDTINQVELAIDSMHYGQSPDDEPNLSITISVCELTDEEYEESKKREWQP